MDRSERKARRAVLYARVSTEEQATRGYSLAQQMDALRDYAACEGFDIRDEIYDPGQSGASLERPGMDRVRDLVAEGGVSLVLAQDWDRISREPAHHYLLEEEFEERGCELKALDDDNDKGPEGVLMRGMKGQIAKYERAKIAERTRRGKLKKARQGKLIGSRLPNFGYAYNDARDNYLVDEEKMEIVRRVFRMAGSEGMSVHGIKRALDAAGVPTPSGRKYWHLRAIRAFIEDDVYRPHTYEGVAVLVAPEVAATLDPEAKYGIWYYNRQRVKWFQATETGPGGKTYLRRGRYSTKDRSEWIAVPVPDAGIPAELVRAAREALLSYRRASTAAGRFWELSGSLMRCAECGRVMTPQKTGYTRRSGTKGYVYYYRCPRAYGYDGECAHRKNHRADKLEPEVWEVVSDLLTDPERLRADLEAMIELEREAWGRGPSREASSWASELAEIDRMRQNYQEMAARGLLTFSELGERLEQLERTRRTVEGQLEALRSRQRLIDDLQKDKDAFLRSCEAVAPEALDSLSPQERHRVYKMLSLRVLLYPDGSLEVDGDGLFPEALAELSNEKPTSANGASRSASASPTRGYGRWSKSARRCRGTRSSSTTRTGR